MKPRPHDPECDRLLDELVEVVRGGGSVYEWQRRLLRCQLAEVLERFATRALESDAEAAA